jgi:8-oxo-dGTP pyrophosphatase MutT (NUDIX family)
MIAGNASDGESPRDAAVREADEELGIITPVSIRFLCDVRVDHGGKASGVFLDAIPKTTKLQPKGLLGFQ